MKISEGKKAMISIIENEGRVEGISEGLIIAAKNGIKAGFSNDIINVMTSLSDEQIDGSVSNELQTLSMSNDTIFLSNGGFVKINPSAILKAPSFTIQPITNLSQTSATFNCTVKANPFLTKVAVYYGLSTTYSNSSVTVGVSGNIEEKPWFTVVSLLPGTTYHYQIRASNAVDLINSPDMTFTTLPGLPTLTTSAIDSIKALSIYTGGNISSDGGAAITARGICWSTSPNPTITNSKTMDGIGTGAFTDSIYGLTPATMYYVRAYATNAVGTAYGQELSFNSLSGIVSLSTNNITPIALNYAASGGNITGDGGSAVIARGVCWSTTTNPTIANSKTIDGSNSGWFFSSLTGLTPATTYYVRAYATNSVGTSYGNELIFTTLSGIVSLTSTSISAITLNSATSGGNITANGGAAVTARGVCWSTTANPTIANNKTTDGTGNGAFTSSLTGLTAGTKYYVRAYATNSVGTSYGNEITFTTLGGVPSATTQAATQLGGTTATLNGIVLANLVTTDIYFEYGTSTAYGLTVNATPASISGNMNTNISAQLTNLTLGSTYHFRVKAVNSVGTTYGTDMTFTASFTVGGNYGGGIIAYIFQSTDPGYVVGETHGLIAASTDQSTNIQWYNGSYTTTGATASTIGSGNANTVAIVATQGVGNYAAKICDDLILNGYNDWYLPSKDELQKLWDNHLLIPGFGYLMSYWSSSENGSENAWFMFGSYNGNTLGGQFSANNIQGADKSNGKVVRAIRKF